MCIQEQFYIKANGVFLWWLNQRAVGLSLQRAAQLFLWRSKALHGWHWVEIRKASLLRIIRSRISSPDGPDCAKEYQEAVAEQWVISKFSLFSFHRATSGRYHPHRVKLKSMFQPSGMWNELDELHFTKSLFLSDVWVTRLRSPSHKQPQTDLWVMNKVLCLLLAV